MALAFITVNAQSSNVMAASLYIPNNPDKNAFTTILDDTDAGVQDLLTNVNSHLFSAIMTGKPYISVYYDGTNVVGTLQNVPASVPSQATISVLGNSYNIAIANNQFSFPVNVHPAVQDQRIPINIRVDGFPYSFIDIGGSNGNIEATTYLNASGVYQVIPYKSADLAEYWQNKMVDMSYSNVDLATADGIAIHTLFHYVLPALNLNLTANEQAGLTEIQNNLLPSLATNLSNISNGGNLDIHYSSYRMHTQQAKQAMDKYVADRIEIGKYIQLK